jgi:hypothetical protein
MAMPSRRRVVSLLALLMMLSVSAGAQTPINTRTYTGVTMDAKPRQAMRNHTLVKRLNIGRRIWQARNSFVKPSTVLSECF